MMKPTKALNEVASITAPAALTIAGQAGATQITKYLLSSQWLANASETVRKLSAFGVPFIVAIALMAYYGKSNKFAVAAAIGAGSSGIMSLLRSSLPALDMIPLAGNAARAMLDNGQGGGQPLSNFVVDHQGNVFDSSGQYLYNQGDMNKAPQLAESSRHLDDVHSDYLDDVITL